MVEERTPSGLFRIRSFISVLIKDKVLPLYSTISFLFTEDPISAICPFTITFFDLINFSQSLLEPTPDLAKNFEVFLPLTKQLLKVNHPQRYQLFLVILGDQKYLLNLSHPKIL